MPYTLRFSHSWEKAYKRLDSITKDRAKEAFLRLMDNPSIGKPLSSNLKGIWSLRIGKYRILYEIDEFNKELLISAIGLRKNIYGR